MVCCNCVLNLISFCTEKQWQLCKMTDMGHSLVEYSLFNLWWLFEWTLKSILLPLFIAAVQWQCLFWVSYHTTVCACHFKTIFFSSWGRAFFIFLITSQGNVGGGLNLHTGEIENNIEEPICQLTQKKRLWSLFKWGWDCWALHCEWLCSEQKGVISSLFCFILKPKWLQWAVFFVFLYS